MRKALALFALVCAFAVAQNNNKGQTVNITPVPEQAVTRLSFYSGGFEIYRCQALTVQPTFTWKVSGIEPPGTTLTSIVVNTNVGTVTTAEDHGLTPGNKVVVAGSTTAALNGTYKIATVPSSSTFTIATSGVNNGTYNNAALKVQTTAPRTTAAIWAVKRLVYSGSDNTEEQWSTTSITNTGNIRMTAICGDRASLMYN